MSSWVRRSFDDIGLTQSPPGPHFVALQRQFGGTVLLCIDVSSSMIGEPMAQAVDGGGRFLREARDAHYRSGLILWNSDVVRHVPPESEYDEVVNVLRGAHSSGGTDLHPCLVLAKRVFEPLSGDRVLCVFGDGDIGDEEQTVAAARELCAMGVRIVVRGLGEYATQMLGRILCPGATPGSSQVITDVSTLAEGIASMASGLSVTRRTG